MSSTNNLKGMNVLVFITDQERAIQHFPPGWAEEHLPGLQRLKRFGLTFNNAFCNACMCSPSRATMMTGYFPAQHGVKWTLETDMQPPANPQKSLPTSFDNLATVMSAAGYSTPYKGKFHLTKPQGRYNVYTPEDVSQYGFERWNPPDAGADQSPSEFGGGYIDNDGRFVTGDGPVVFGQEGICEYLRSYSGLSKEGAAKPFFLIASLVNPHDVLAYPTTAFYNGYTPEWLEGDIHLPPTVDEDLSTKPAVQTQLLTLLNMGMGKLDAEQKRRYINFYGNLMIQADQYLVHVLDELEAQGLLRNTLIIRTSDHGEMGMSHGGMRQKNFNFYEETLRVPLIYSNPTLFPTPVSSDAMVSHVDFLPTLAGLFPGIQPGTTPWQGIDYSSVILNSGQGATQDYIVFTFDDYQSGQANGPYPGPLNHIVSIREERYKLAKYYSVDYPDLPPEWEMYDLQHDPNERHNIGWSGAKRTEHQEVEFSRLKARLAEVEQTRLQPLPRLPSASEGSAS